MIPQPAKFCTGNSSLSLQPSKNPRPGPASTQDRAHEDAAPGGTIGQQIRRGNMPELAEIQRAEAENDLKKLKRIEVWRAKDLDALADIALSRKYKAGWLIKQAAAKHIHARLPWKDACAAMMAAQSRARNKVLTV